MRTWLWFLSLLILLISPLSHAAGKALLLNISGAIGPATQDYIERGIAYAQQEHATIIIIQIDTPGGLDSSMRGINQAIITSPIPIIGYVAPAGARAASAGTYIMYASHINAMASGTNIGAASPINLLSPSKSEKEPSTEEKKVSNDASAYLRSLAQLRHRNADWANLAVRNAASISAADAKKLNVIDIVADNFPELFKQIDGRIVFVHGVTQTLNTNDMQIEKMSPDWRYQFLQFLTNPNIAYILMLIAIYGIFFELSNPGLVLPGVAGIISLLLVLYAFQLMPINYVGLMLVLVGIAFMIFEVFVSSFGAIGVGGVIAFIIGSIMLFDVHDANYHLDWSLIVIMSAVSIIFFLFLITLAIRSHKQKIVTGREALIGKEGVVLSVMNEQVVVRILGEIWDARSSHLLNVGQRVKVTHVHGLQLTVSPLETQKEIGE